jgi:transglutaminase-like putative cysteine protease
MPADNFTYLCLRGPVQRTGLLDPVLQALTPAAGQRLFEWFEQVNRHIHEHFEYARHVTNVSSPIDDLLRHGKGVCQDFAHLMIAVLRAFGVPARYVSGYIHRPNKESQSHAWCEAWTPDRGWIGLDPTNNRVVDDHFVRVAVGRDFSDVTPNKGTFRGSGKESMWVRVETYELDALPPVSWQENLPPLDVPLTAIGNRAQREEPGDEQMQQQQQQ